MAKQYNRVMLGRGGKFAEECRKGGYIGTGFNIAEDLTSRLTDDVKKFIKENTPLLMAGEPDKTLNSARLGCGMLWTVCCGLKKGDVVLSPINKKEYIVGEIIGDYYYAPNTELLHRRPVKWYDVVLNRKDMSSKLQNSARSAGTCSDLSQYATEIEALIHSSIHTTMSISNSQFTWIPFYQEFADTLLSYRNKRHELLQWIYANLEGYINSFHDAESNFSDIDPFTIMALFNRSMRPEKRLHIIQQFKDHMHIQAPIPQDFNGIPVANPQNSNFRANSNDPKFHAEDIDALWDMLEAIVKKPEQLEKTYTRALNLPYVNNKLTMAMFWCRPNDYLALDGNNRSSLNKIHVSVPNGRVEYDAYIHILNELKEKIRTHQIPQRSFPEFSDVAWKEVSKNDNPQTTSEDIEHTQPVEGQQYWWLTGSPKYWSPTQDWELGEDVDYTLYNEKGNKRRIFKHFLAAKPGDAVIVYEATPVLQVVAIGKVMSETDGEVLYIRKMEELAVPVPYADILANPILKKSEPGVNRCQGSLFQLTKEEYNEVMKLIRKDNPEPVIDIIEDEEVSEYKPYSDKDFLEDVYIGEDQLNTLKSLLLRKKNLILQGAPGVGKTYAAQRLAYAIMGEKDDNRVRVIQFHQNYSYEDFVMGYKPNNEGGFSLANGIFFEFCQQARSHRNMPYFLIIDEINRGNMSKIFGELLQLIEADYRDKPIQLAYNKQRFSVPDNLYIIGMMNTADRSLAMIDYALRRRFCFFKMKPVFRSDGFKKYQASLHNALLDKVVDHIEQLNDVICADTSLGDGFAIGHSYFCGLKQNAELNKKIEEIVRYDVIPMLEEYWFDDQKTLKEQTDRLSEALK